MTAPDITAAVRLAERIDNFDAEETARICDENNEPPMCIACGGEYRMMDDDEPTPTCDACAHLRLTDLARALLAEHKRRVEVERERDMFHQLLCVVELMEPGESPHDAKVFRASMPSLASLFRADESDAIYLSEAVTRAVARGDEGRE